MPRPKAREDGEGSYYQLADGRWRVEITVGNERTPDGRKRRVRRYEYAPDEKAAKKLRRDMLVKKEQGELPVGEQVTLAAWMTYWLEEIAAHKCTDKTMESYRTLTRNWIIPTIGHVRLKALQPEHVEQLHKAMRAGREFTVTTRAGNSRVLPAKPLSSATRLQTHRVLSRALKVAHQRGKVRRNVAALVDAPSLDRNRVEQWLSADEARAFLTHIDGRWNAARWSVGLSLGSRQGETLGLRWDDVDLDAGTLEIRNQLQRRKEGGGLVLAPRTKSGKPRTVTIPAPLVKQLRAHRTAQSQRRLQIGAEWVGSDLGEFVFCTPYGRAIEPRADWQDWTDILAALNITHIRQHAARHTAATLMLVQGVDVTEAARILGHSSTQITRDLYQHVDLTQMAAATDAVAEALWGNQA